MEFVWHKKLLYMNCSHALQLSYLNHSYSSPHLFSCVWLVILNKWKVVCEIISKKRNNNWVVKWFIPLACICLWQHYTKLFDVAVKVTTWSFKGKNFQWGLHSIMLRRLFWNNLVNWPPLRFQKLTFRVSTVCQRETFLCHSLWWRAWNAIFSNLNSGQFNYNSVDDTNLPCNTLPWTQYHNFFRNLPPYPFNLIFNLLLLF